MIRDKFAYAMSGKFLPMQLTYKGTTTKLKVKVSIRLAHYITYTENYWANEITTMVYMYLRKVIIPYQRRSEVIKHLYKLIMQKANFPE